MGCAKVNAGSEQCLQMYKGDDVVNFTFTYLNADGTAFDFTGGTGYAITFYEERDGRVLNSTINLTVSSNVITWSDLYTDLALEIGTWYQSMTYTDTDGNFITLEYGTLNVI